MNNLFKKGFASLALASAMTSSIFAGNAAYIDVKIKYLSGKDKAVLGASDDKKERVELLVSVLDKDGAYATKGADGVANIAAMESKSSLGVIATIDDGQISRDLDKTKNISRYVFDYTDANSTNALVDAVTFTSGVGAAKVERSINIDLVSVDAKGLVVRATPNGNFKTLRHVNQTFSFIAVTGEDQNLSLPSSKAPGGLVGLTIPIQVYASTLENNLSVTGDFTLAPNLEGKIIVVTPLADTNNNSTPNFALPSIEITMKNGQANGEIMMTRGMPAGNDGVLIEAAPNDGKFELGLTEGLGISFLVYVKDSQKINNYIDANANDLNFTDNFTFDKNLTEDSPSTDTIQMVSGVPASFKVGSYNLDTGKWEKTSSTITLLDGNDTTVDRGLDGTAVEANATHEASATLTVVDSYGNPAIARADVTSKVRFGSETKNKFILVSSGNVAVNANSGISTITVNIADSYDTNNTKTIKIIKTTIDASNRVLASLDPVELIIKTLPLVEVSIDGGVKLKSAIKDVNTSLNTTGITPLETAAANILTVTEADFTVEIKGMDIDGNSSDSNGSLGIYIIDNSGENKYLSGSDLKKYIIGASKIDLGADSSLDIVDKTSDNYYRIDIDANSTVTDANFTIEINSSATVKFAHIVVNGYGAKDIGEEEVTVKIPNYEDKKINAFVEFSINDADYPKEVAKPGSKLNFKFSGIAVNEGDTVVIELNSSGLTSASGANTAVTTVDNNHTEGTIALVGGTATTFTNKVTTTLPKDGMVSVILRDVNRTDAGYYGVKSVTINGVKPIFMYLNENKDTDEIIELKESAMITMSRLEDQDITTVSVQLVTDGAGDGSEDEKRKALPGMLSANKKPLSTNTEVLTGLYYDIFTDASNIKFTDKYGNEIDGLKDDIKKDVTFSYTDGIEFSNDGADSWIKFKDSAAGTSQTLTVSFSKDDASLVSNTITWTKIKLSKKNSGFIITDHNGGFVDPNTGIFDVVDSEIVVKVIGNGNQKQATTKITLTHSVKEAKVRLTKVSDVSDGAFANALSGISSSITTTIASDGSYYIVSTDTEGVLTIDVSSKVKDDKDNDVVIKESHTITFDAIDIDKPMVVDSGVVASGGTITVEVTDKNLNTILTTVTVSDINDAEQSMVKAVYTDGKYVATVNSAGIYQVEIVGVDMAENRQRFNFTRVLGKAGTLEDNLIAHGSYEIDGTFAAYDFKDVDSAFDWVYTQGETMNQLNAKDSEDVSAFKWGTVTDITPETKNVWYMVRLTGPAGSSDEANMFGWVLVNAKGDTFKLAGANSDGTFKFSKALYVKGTMSGSNISFAKR